MRKILKRNTHRELLDLHAVLGSKIRDRHHFRFHAACDLLERMIGLVIRRDSWETGGRKR